MNPSNASSYVSRGYDDHKDYDIDIEYYDYKDQDYKGKQCT